MAVALSETRIPETIGGSGQSPATSLVGSTPEIISQYANQFSNNIATDNAIQVGSSRTTFTGAFGYVNYYLSLVDSNANADTCEYLSISCSMLTLVGVTNELSCVCYQILINHTSAASGNKHYLVSQSATGAFTGRNVNLSRMAETMFVDRLN